MVPIRLQTSRSPPTASRDGTQARLPEQTNVRNTHDASGNDGLVLLLEAALSDHEAEKTNARRSEVDLVTPACPVEETARKTLHDDTKERMMSLSSIVERCAPAEEKNSGSSGESGMETGKKSSLDRVGGRVSMSSIMKKHGLKGRYKLKALQAILEEEFGIQEGAKPCALMTSLHRKVPWQCPLMAMEHDKLCEYHIECGEARKLSNQK